VFYPYKKLKLTWCRGPWHIVLGSVGKVGLPLSGNAQIYNKSDLPPKSQTPFQAGPGLGMRRASRQVI
jgi:hypothetical protein